MKGSTASLPVAPLSAASPRYAVGFTLLSGLGFAVDDNMLVLPDFPSFGL